MILIWENQIWTIIFNYDIIPSTLRYDLVMILGVKVFLFLWSSDGSFLIKWGAWLLQEKHREVICKESIIIIIIIITKLFLANHGLIHKEQLQYASLTGYVKMTRGRRKQNRDALSIAFLWTRMWISACTSELIWCSCSDSSKASCRFVWWCVAVRDRYELVSISILILRSSCGRRNGKWSSRKPLAISHRRLQLFRCRCFAVLDHIPNPVDVWCWLGERHPFHCFQLIKHFDVIVLWRSQVGKHISFMQCLILWTDKTTVDDRWSSKTTSTFSFLEETLVQTSLKVWERNISCSWQTLLVCHLFRMSSVLSSTTPRNKSWCNIFFTFIRIMSMRQSAYDIINSWRFR